MTALPRLPLASATVVRCWRSLVSFAGVVRWCRSLLSFAGVVRCCRSLVSFAVVVRWCRLLVSFAAVVCWCRSLVSFAGGSCPPSGQVARGSHAGGSRGLCEGDQPRVVASVSCNRGMKRRIMPAYHCLSMSFRERGDNCLKMVTYFRLFAPMSTLYFLIS